MRIFTKYKNRRIYDPQEQRLVTTSEIVGLVRQGVPLRVKCMVTGLDVTKDTLLNYMPQLSMHVTEEAVIAFLRGA